MLLYNHKVLPIRLGISRPQTVNPSFAAVNLNNATRQRLVSHFAPSFVPESAFRSYFKYPFGDHAHFAEGYRHIYTWRILIHIGGMRRRAHGGYSGWLYLWLFLLDRPRQISGFFT